jgi:hypothetical protein
MTGPVDYLSDGERIIAIRNGHEFLGQVSIDFSTSGEHPSPLEFLWLTKNI